MRRALPAILLLACMAPAATAQLAFGAPVVTGLPLVPNSGMAGVAIPVSYSCAPGEVRLGSTTLTLSDLTTPQGTTLFGRLAYAIPGSACQGPASQPWRATLHFNLTASPDTVGEKPLSFSLRGTVPATAPGEGVAMASQATVEGTFSVAYYGLIAATVPSTIDQAGPGQDIVYNITLTNLGNANTNVNAALDGSAPSGWTATPPASIILGPSQQAGGTDFTRTVQFRVHTPNSPGFSNEDAFRLFLTPSSTLDSTRTGPAIAVNVLARVRGCSGGAACLANPAPAAGPLAGLLALGCALMLARSSRRRQPPA